jgi:frataxin-like iron-binding protein CyaY
VTSWLDNDGTKVEESIAEGVFGMHSFDDLTAFCIEKVSPKHRVWVGGKDD